MSQAKRYNTLCALTGRTDLDCAYHAAFYLLSYDKDIYEVACNHVRLEGIGFSQLKRATKGFDERSRFVVDIAHNLFSYNSACKATPFEISRLGYPLMELVCNAFYIAAGEVKVVIAPDENNHAKMTLDANNYQKTKQVYSRFEKLQADMMTATEHGKADTMER